ncbi:MAG: lipid II:glycine glycyltransferase FemX [Candidatus Promineifilaceae bacterium]
MLDRLMQIEEAPYNEEDAEWDAFVADHPHGSILQTSRWARLKSRFGWRSRRVWLRQDGRLAAGAQLLMRSAALGLIRVAYTPHGPLLDWRNQELTAVMLNQLDFAAYELGAGLLKLEPLVWQAELPAEEWQAICRQQGCRPETDTVQPPRTLVVDLRPQEDAILAAMKPKTRYNIGLAAKKGVAVRQGTAEDLPAFNRLMVACGRRNEFGVHEPAYYQAAYELFAPEGVGLFLAEHEGRPLAAVMAFKHGQRAAYFYGASSDEERQRMPTYAVQWAAMQWAKMVGCVEYDLWGVPDRPAAELEADFAERQDGLWGVYRFKRGFGGELRRTVGAADRVYNKLAYRLYRRRRAL